VRCDPGSVPRGVLPTDLQGILASISAEEVRIPLLDHQHGRRNLAGDRRTAQVTLEDLALLAEFDGDTDATECLLGCLEYGYPLEHTAERIRQDRAEARGGTATIPAERAPAGDARRGAGGDHD
jgi:hypothetical protein